MSKVVFTNSPSVPVEILMAESKRAGLLETRTPTDDVDDDKSTRAIAKNAFVAVINPPRTSSLFNNDIVNSGSRTTLTIDIWDPIQCPNAVYMVYDEESLEMGCFFINLHTANGSR